MDRFYCRYRGVLVIYLFKQVKIALQSDSWSVIVRTSILIIVVSMDTKQHIHTR